MQAYPIFLRRIIVVLGMLLGAVLVARPLTAAEEFPPGWLPLNKLDDKTEWREFRAIDDKVHLYLPSDKPVRGVFVCFVFHSADPRELARLWNFALVTIPWPFEYDLGHNDKRNGRYKLGHEPQNMGLLLRYLEETAKQTGHPELAVAPMVGWLGQNGSHLGNDLWQRAPDRIIAWSDSFANRLEQYPKFTAAVPFAYAWEFSSAEGQTRQTLRQTKLPTLIDKKTPPLDFRARANTYGFSHGIYSKFNYFAAYLDRCIRLRLPEQMPPPGEKVKLKPIQVSEGWAGDFNAISEWNPIAPAGEAAGMVEPMWFPDVYAAWMWRTYHSAKPDLKITSPVLEYRKKDGKWGGPECGLGYGGQRQSNEALRFAAETTGNYVKIEFHDGDRIIGSATAAPWEAPDIKLEPGLHALFAVGVKADGSRCASRPGFLIVE